jgi:hypothetical protein
MVTLPTSRPSLSSNETLKSAVVLSLFLLGYWMWLFMAHLLGISLVTYGMMDSAPKFTEIADLYFNNYWTVQGWAGLLFFLFNFGLTVGRQAHWPELSARNWRGTLLPTLIKTILGSVLWVLLTLWLTPSQFLGPGFSFEEGLWSALNCVIRALAWLGWAVGEEWVFRKVALERLKKILAASLGPRATEWATVLGITFLWVLTRSWHQQLGLNQTLTLSLVGLALGFYSFRGGSYLNGAAILGGATLSFQVLFSLPVLGHEFTGFWIIKYRSSDLLHFVSGGAGGPLSSAILQLGLVSWIAGNFFGRTPRHR